MIREAIRDHSWFQGMQPRIYAKGSYANNTNVRLDSDVDVVVEFTKCLYYDATRVQGFSPAAAGIWTPAQYAFGDFKFQVHLALIARFGVSGVSRGNKAFDVHENTARVDADVVPCWEYRLFHGAGPNDYYKGTEFIADDGRSIVNWPEQQKTNGNLKNVRTGGRYKFITRAVKRLHNEMAGRGYVSAEPIPSYFIECLIYNVPDNFLGHSNYSDDVKYALAHVIADKRPDTSWVEVNEMKYLYNSGQSWTRAQAEAFALDAYRYCGFGR
jgi:hypothetical protein